MLLKNGEYSKFSSVINFQDHELALEDHVESFMVYHYKFKQIGVLKV